MPRSRQLETRQAGKPIRLTREFDVPGTIDNIAFFAGAARNLEGKATGEYSADHTSSIRREPIGVIGSISPWNYPLQMAAWKILPAIAAGNTIVLKPAEITPLTSLLFAQVATEAGIPDGVINVITGRGSTVGAELLRHPDVDMLSFTGSTGVGRTVLEAAATTAKRVHLELGGKAPFVVFDDADLEAADPRRRCRQPDQHRPGLHRSHPRHRPPLAVRGLHLRRRRAVRQGQARAHRRSGHGPGPLVSQAHRDKVAEMVDRARGYARVIGGGIPDGELASGSYYRPTLVADATPDSEIFRDEVFGPSWPSPRSTPTMKPSPWPTTPHTGSPPLPGPRTSTVPCGPRVKSAPAASGSTTTSRSSVKCRTAAIKQSGFGKDMSTYSFDEYTVVKHVMFDLTAEKAKAWHRTIFTLDG